MGLLLALLPAAGAVAPLSTAVPGGVIAPKLSVRPPLPEERGKGGILAAAPISCMETIARIPRGPIAIPFSICRMTKKSDTDYEGMCAPATASHCASVAVVKHNGSSFTDILSEH